MIDERMKQLVEDLERWTMCMSYNDSYVGEPPGFLKKTIRQMTKHVEAHEAAEKLVAEMRAEEKEKEALKSLMDCYRLRNIF